MSSVFFVVFLVLFSNTPATETSPEGYPQMTLIQRHTDVDACKKAIEKLPLEPKEKEHLGCVRILKGNVKWVEA